MLNKCDWKPNISEVEKKLGTEERRLHQLNIVSIFEFPSSLEKKKKGSN